MDKIIVGDELTLVLSIGSKVSNEWYYFIVLKETGTKIGTCGIRLGNVKDIKYLGNIEYEIFEPYRSNHYAEKAARLISKIAIDQNIDSLNITVRPTNIASIKTIENLGAKYVEKVKVPKNSKLYKDSKYVSIYKWNLKGEKTK